MKVICLICKKSIYETDEEQDLVSHGMHEACGIEYYQELDLLPILHEA